jgi:molybdate transport system substrate-binding protein
VSRPGGVAALRPLLLALLLAGCTAGSGASSGSAAGAGGGSAGRSPEGSPGVAAAQLTVFAAASLQGVLDEAKTAYEAAHPGTTLTVSTGSSAALETQIELGAPADVFLSADTANAQKLVADGFASGSPVVFARNELTVIVPKDDPAGVASPADLAKPGLRIIAAGDAVPITRYANQLVANLAALPGYPADFAAAYEANVASREDDVKAVLAKVELGEGDAGIVYVTDAAASSKVRTIPVPAAANVPATYAGAVVKDSAQPDAARAFLDWLAGSGGQAILARFGFLPPS